MAAERQLPLIGRDRVLVDMLTKQLHDAARQYHDYGAVCERARGASFMVRLFDSGGQPTGRVVRVVIELDRVE